MKFERKIAMKKIENTLDSREVAEMVGKDHNKLLRDIRNYISQLDASKIGHTDFFTENYYKDKSNRQKPCYRISRKGCEFIANKLTGTKGTAFTARYILRFHEMEEILKQNKEKPWYIRRFRGKDIILFRDFETLTGVKLDRTYTSTKRADRLEGGADWNGYGWKCDNEEFRNRYRFDYGDDDCMCYLYMSGLRKALQIIQTEGRMQQNAIAVRSLEGICTQDKPQTVKKQKNSSPDNAVIQIRIELNQNGIEIC